MVGCGRDVKNKPVYLEGLSKDCKQMWRMYYPKEYKADNKFGSLHLAEGRNRHGWERCGQVSSNWCVAYCEQCAVARGIIW